MKFTLDDVRTALNRGQQLTPQLLLHQATCPKEQVESFEVGPVVYGDLDVYAAERDVEVLVVRGE